MNIVVAENEQALRQMYPVMAQLRPQLSEAEFIARSGRMMRDTTFKLAYLEADGAVQAAAGYRILENLFCGMHMYVDDLVTSEAQRSRGFGGALVDWLVELARAQGCVEFHLDSGVHRFDAHRFYFRKGMHISSYHFRLKLS